MTSTSRIFQGGTADWYLATSWLPQRIPTAGDILSVGSGNATISAADVTTYGTLNNETLKLGGSSSGAPAVFSADGASFGSAFTINSQGAGFAALDLSGSVLLAGSLVANTAGGQTALNITVDSTGTSAVTLTGGISIANGDSVVVNGGTVVDNGVVTVSSGILTLGSSTSLQGTGTIVIGANGTVMIDGPVAPGVSIEFTANTGTLLLADPLFFNGAVSGFVKGDAIDLVGAPSYDWTYGTVSTNLTVLGGNSSQAPEVAKFALTSNAPLTASQIFVGQDGNGGSEIQLVDVRTWVGSTGDWYNSSNWTTAGTSSANSYPLFGDTAIISSGTATISASDVTTFGTLNNGRIMLSGNGTALQITDDTLGTDLRITSAGSQTTNTLVFDGTTTSSARISATGNGSTVQFAVGNAGPTAGDFVNAQFGTILVGAEALLDFNSGRVTNQSQIVLNGAATIATSATVDGTGVIELNSNAGVLTVAGSVATGQQIAFDSVSSLIIAAGAQFQGKIEQFTQGDTIDVAGVIANYASYDVANSRLTLRQGGPGGSIVATLNVAGNYGATDFKLSSDGNGGTDITTFGTAGIGYAYSILPVPAVAAAGGTVSLSSLLVAAFGTNSVASLPNFQLWSDSPADMQYFSYWDPNNPSLPYWTVNGTIVAPDNYEPVLASELPGVQYVSGNAIVAGSQVQIPVAFDNLGNPTFYVDYHIQNFPSQFAQPSLYTGHPTPQDVVNAASAFAAAYTGVPNTEDCWNIANDVAAAAGAAMGWLTYYTDPEANQASGFWRINYAAPQNGSAISNWSSLVQAGDILRIGWASGGPHSFTVVSPLDQNGNITVFDNIYYATPTSYEAIGIHTAQYWTQTNPNDITIYRLDPNDLYLIDNITANKALIQGTNFNDLIIPEGTADTISGAGGSDLVADTSTILSGATITDFHAGDRIDFTDLNSATTSVGYNAATGVLTLTSLGTQVASMQLPTGLAGTFTINNDGGTAGLDGGTLGVLYNQLYASPSAQGSLLALVTCFAAGTRIATSEGEVAVEHLSVGDEVICDGGRRERITWIGYRHLDIRRHPAPEKVLPIRITAGAFGDGLPRRDLLLSPDHAVFAEGVLIPIRYLMNGTTIVQLPAKAMAKVSYYHVELPRHDVIQAEGLPVESYLDAGDRNRFSNADMPMVLHPDFASRVWEAAGYAPLRIVGPEVAAVRAKLRTVRPARRRRAARR